MIFDINLFQGDAYVPQSELVSIVANVYRTRLSHALAVSNAIHTNGSHTGPLHWKIWTSSTEWNFYFQNIFIPRKTFPYYGRGLFFSSASEREMGIGLSF